MDKKEYLATVGALVHLQTYQCYNSKAFKQDIRKQCQYIKSIMKAASFDPLTDKEMLALFLNMNAHDINEKFVIDTLKLKV